MNIDILRKLDEWTAVGYYEDESLQFPRRYGLAYRYTYENMKIMVYDNTLIIPSESSYKCLNNIDDNVWTATNSILNIDHSAGLQLRVEMAELKKKQYPQYADFIDDFVEDLSKQGFGRAQYIHSNPDTYTIIEKGFNHIKDELESEILKVEEDSKEYHFLMSEKDYVIGIDAYYENIKLAIKNKLNIVSGKEKKELELIYTEFSKCFYTKAETFLQGILSINLVWMLDNCDSIGRYDYALGKLYDNDIAISSIDIKLVRRLLDEVFHIFEKMNGWNMQLGGYDANGKDISSEFTKECLLACKRNKYRRPNVAFRINKQTKKEYIMTALDAIAKGSGRPALYNDDLYIELLMKNFPELTYEDAVMYGFGGCTETMITSLSCCDSLAGQINIAYALSLAMFDGYDILKNTQVGPKTGEFDSFNTFDDFFLALKAQIKHMTDNFVSDCNKSIISRFNSYDPKVARSLFTRDCIKNHKSFEAGGARYNWSVVSYEGTSVTIDSLSAIRETVFDKKIITNLQLIDAIRNNYNGYEDIRKILKSQPTYGNDIMKVDYLGKELLEYSWKLLLSYETPRGGKYVPSIILFTTYEEAGKGVCATANGRCSKDYLNDSVGACAGIDENGPTALINSVLRMPSDLGFGTPVFNIRCHKKMLDSDNGKEKYAMMIQNYFQRGGLQIQISVLDAQELIKAQENPNEYKDLIVRVGGYSEYFVNMSPQLQDSVIKRTIY